MAISICEKDSLTLSHRHSSPRAHTVYGQTRGAAIYNSLCYITDTHMSSFSCVSVNALCTHFICVGICVRVSIADILLSTRLSPPDLLYSECTVCYRRKEDCVCQEKNPLLLRRVFLSPIVWRKSISNS